MTLICSEGLAYDIIYKNILSNPFTKVKGFFILWCSSEVEQGAVNTQVVGSIPTIIAKGFIVQRLVRQIVALKAGVRFSVEPQ